MRTVFFDFGGTLVEAQPAIDVWLRVLEETGMRPASEDLEEALARTDAEFVPRLYEYKGRMPRFWAEYNARLLSRLGAEDDGTLAAEIERNFKTGETYRVFPEAHEALEFLRAQGYGLGVVSNNTDDLLAILPKLGLDRHFDHVTYSQEAGAEKPDPMVFRLALRRAGCAAAEAVHVGDRYDADVVGARRAGIAPILLDREDRRRDADCPRVRDLRGIEALLEGRRA